MIAVTFALPDESTIFLKSMTDLKRVRAGAVPIYFGKIGDLEVTVFHTGVGEESAQIQLNSFLSKERPQFLISSGFAGGLDPLLKIGSLLLSENYSSPVLLNSAREFFKNKDSIHFGILTTQSLPAESVASKHALFLETKALGVDMETATLARICAQSSIPFLSLRAISDTAFQALPVPFSAWFDPIAQKARPLALLGYLAMHPTLILDFVQFVKGIFQTKKIIGHHLVDLIQFIHSSEEIEIFKSH